MKPIQISDDILPIAEFKTHAGQVIRKLKADKRAMVITQNGRPAAVLVLPADFDRLTACARFAQAVEEGLADSRDGRVVDDASLGSDLDRAFGKAPRAVRR
jgi:antitoxin YefM